MTSRAQQLLAHDRLLALGGPRHGELLPIRCAADMLLVAAPLPPGIGSFDVEVNGPPPGLDTVSYRRTRIVLDGDVTAGASMHLLLCDGYRLGQSGYLELVERLGVALIVSLCSGVVRDEWLAAEMAWQEAAAIVERSLAQMRGSTPQLDDNDDTWSQAELADLCWRCDATRGTTDVGLCDACHTDLRAVA